MSAFNQYITTSQVQALLDALNVTMDDPTQQDLLDRATADMEADLAQRFIVPLIDVSETGYANAPLWVRNKVLNTLRSKIKQLIGYDQNKNTVIESTQKFIDIFGIEYSGHKKSLLDPKTDFQLKQLEYTEGAVAPVQTMGIARANNRARVVVDYEGDL